MQLLAPDILAEARGLSAAACGAGLVIGLLLWLTGWWGHRFWTVLFATVVAGILGLYSGRIYGIQPVMAGLLLALAAGTLALALVRVLAFAAGGVAVWLAVRTLAPSWNQPLVCFVVGGLGGVLLFRLWMMTLTSLAGTLLVGYSALCLADRFGKVDAIAWTEQRAVLLNWVCGGGVLLGLVAQFLLELWQIRRRKRREEEERLLAQLNEAEEFQRRHRHWWNRGWDRWNYRRAG